MKWIIKAIVQKTISIFPQSHRINYWFQKNITKGVNLTDQLLVDKLNHLRKHAVTFQNINSQTPKTCLELGTGWYPIIPLGFYLLGSDNIYTIDITNLLKLDNLKLAIKKLIEFKNISDYIQVDDKRLEELQQISNSNQTMDQILKRLNITYLVEDARKLNLSSNSIDYIVSNNVLEHIKEEILIDILFEFKRIQSPNGMQSHFIDMSDHFSHMDSSISNFNNLKFNKFIWSLIDNSVQPQNRLRINQYRKLVLNDYKILEEENRIGDKNALGKIRLAKPFNQFDKIDIAVTHSHLFLKLKQ